MSYNRITLNIIPVQANNSSPCFMSKNTRQSACCSNVNTYSLWCYDNGVMGCFFFCLYLWFSLCNRMRREPMWLTETQLTLVPSSTTCGMANWFTTKSWPKKVFDMLWCFVSTQMGSGCMSLFVGQMEIRTILCRHTASSWLSLST